MSNFTTILDRLVKENLHGPIDQGNSDALRARMTRQQAVRRNGEHPNSDLIHSKEDSDDGEGDMDSRDPRWRQLFHDFFLSEHSDDRNDDLLFFVQKPSSASSFESGETGGLGVDPIFVKRNVHKGSAEGYQQRILSAEQEAFVLWKDTFFLNVIVQLPCKLTVAVCSRVAETNPITGITKTSMTCTRKHVSKRVYALPTKSRVDVKEATVECSWPLIYYVIDDYEDMFEQLMVRDNEYLCVELAVTLPTASTDGTMSSSRTTGPTSPTSSQHRTRRAIVQDTHWSQPPGNDGLQAGRPFPSASPGRGGSGLGAVGGGKITLFQGAAGFQSLLGIYQQKAASKVGRRFKFGPHTVPTEFVMMRGPGGRGHAQVAITASNAGDDSSSLTHLEGGSPTSGTLGSPLRGPNSTSSMRSEKHLPQIPGSDGNENGNGNGHYHHHRPEKIGISTSPASPTQPSKSSPPPSSSSKSFSTGSFFQSLRRISLATLAQAASVTSSPSPSVISERTNNSNMNNNPLAQNHVNKSSHSIESPSDNAPSSPNGRRTPQSIGQDGSSGISASGVGSRHEIEALVKQPQSLRCCMTFVNVPWTGIVALLMDHAYSNPSAPQG